MPLQIMSNQFDLPQVNSRQGVETAKIKREKKEAPELNFKCFCNGSEKFWSCDFF